MAKRYVVTMDFYVMADDDESAIMEAEAIANDRKSKYDDRAEVTGIREMPFGSMSGRKVK